MSDTRDTEYRLVMGVICGVCMLGPLGAVFPVVEHVAGIGFGVLFGLLALAGLAYAGRELLRELRLRVDMRALDRRDAVRRARRASVAWQRSGGAVR